MYKFALLFLVVIFGSGCLEIKQSPFSEVSAFYAAIVGEATRNGTTVAITVTGADQNNTNKSTPAAAVQLYAATTRYQTTGYTTEKTQLTDNGGGNHTGSVPIVDSSSVTIIVWDDMQTVQHPYGGTRTVSDGSGSHTLIITDNYFSPCQGLLATSGTQKPLYEMVLFTTQGAAASPRMPGVTSPTTPATTNDEVFSLHTNQTQGSNISIDYSSLGKGSTSILCGCTHTVDLVDSSTVSGQGFSPIKSGYFTDSDSENTSTSCPTRS